MTTGTSNIQVEDLKTKRKELSKKQKEFSEEFKAQVTELEQLQKNLTELE
jgi:uncharacterized protein involved in exopolysaccharide biosynthesis